MIFYALRREGYTSSYAYDPFFNAGFGPFTLLGDEWRYERKRTEEGHSLWKRLICLCMFAYFLSHGFRSSCE